MGSWARAKVLWWLAIMFILLAGMFGQFEVVPMAFACITCAFLCLMTISAINDGSET